MTVSKYKNKDLLHHNNQSAVAPHRHTVVKIRSSFCCLLQCITKAKEFPESGTANIHKEYSIHTRDVVGMTNSSEALLIISEKHSLEIYRVQILSRRSWWICIIRNLGASRQIGNCWWTSYFLCRNSIVHCVSFVMRRSRRIVLLVPAQPQRSHEILGQFAHYLPRCDQSTESFLVCKRVARSQRPTRPPGRWSSQNIATVP